MAYSTRSRDPLLDSETQAVIEKRSKELLGLLLVGLGVIFGAIILSYSPADPNWMVSTDASVQNWLGRPGASVAAVLMMVLGWGSLSISALFLAWGARFVLHRGADRAVGRLIFAPIVIVFSSVYAATLVPGQDWIAAHDFGLGGLLGYTIIGAFLTLLPISSVLLIKLLSAAMAVGLLGAGAYVLGFTRPELRAIGRFLFLGLVFAYSGLISAFGRGAQRVGAAAQSRREARLHARNAAPLTREHEVEDDDVLWEDPDPEEDFVEEEKTTKTGFFGRMPGLIRRPEPLPEPELVETFADPVLEDEEFDGAPRTDRIRAKIADAVRTRRAADTPPDPAADKPLTKGRGQRPEPLIFAASPDGLPPEPPLSAELEAIDPIVDLDADHPDAHDPWQPDVAAPEGFNDAADFEAEQAHSETIDPEDAAPIVRGPTPRVPVAEPRKVVLNPLRKSPEPSRRAQAEAQPSLEFEEPRQEFELPPLNLLTDPRSITRHHLSDEALEENARMLENVLDDYGVKGEIVSVRPGPVVTMYELEPAPGLKASRVIGLADDIARSMAALSARVSTVPGRSVIGIELPNDNREMVVLREILAARDFGDSNHALPLALGKDIGGTPMVANLAKMPHLLIAGTTGSGKSVAINTMILSLLYKLSPDECRLIMIDPKMLELSVYDGIPHLLSPVVTDPKKAVVALKWVVGEMEDRYRKMSKMGVRNIAGYNGRVEDALSRGETFSRTVQTGFDDETGDPVFETEEIIPVKLPYIVVIVDEMADLMMVAGKEIEACIQRLAQMARASGIHLIMATQRPSVDVITGTIKANFPTRISFQVTSKVDSRTILGEMGAEQLLGMGDMLYMAGGAKITRCHGPFVSDEEVEEIVNHLKAFGPPDYIGGVVEGPDEEKADNIDTVLGLNTGGNTTGEDALYDQAVAVVIKDRKCSTSYIQRKLAIGYNKAARLVEQMEDEGIVSAANHVGKREILIPEQ